MSNLPFPVIKGQRPLRGWRSAFATGIPWLSLDWPILLLALGMLLVGLVFVEQMAAKTKAQAKRGIRVPKPALTGVRTMLSGLRDSCATALDVPPSRLTAATTEDAAAFRAGIASRLEGRITPAYDRLLAVFDAAYTAAAPTTVAPTTNPAGGLPATGGSGFGTTTGIAIGLFLVGAAMLAVSVVRRKQATA